MRTTDDRLSRAASAIWRLRTAELGPYGNPSGDRGVVLEYVKQAGYRTPGDYNSDLRSRMIADNGGMPTRRVYDLLSILEIEDVCECGAALNVTSHRTGQYGGGWDTFVKCPGCDYAEVYV